MTERLAQLMHAEADRLDVPPPDATRTLTRGRGLRRRRRVAVGMTTLAVVAVIGGGALGVDALRQTTDDHRLPGDLQVSDPAAARAAYESQGAYAIGRDLYVGPNRFRWKEAIKALHYTSAGVVIQSGRNESRNEGGSNYTLVTPTGEASDIDVTLDDQIVGFEPDSARLAYTEPADEGYDLVVHDVADDQELARIHLDVPWSMGWATPTASIDGDLAWVRTDDGWVAIDWRTGDGDLVSGTDHTHELANGVYADWTDQRWVMRRMADSSVIRELDLRPGWYGFLSPDGRFLRAFRNDTRSPAGPAFEIFEVATGRKSAVRGDDQTLEMGWTPDGHVLELDGTTLSVCEPTSGACESHTIERGPETVRLGGEPYGS